MKIKKLKTNHVFLSLTEEQKERLEQIQSSVQWSYNKIILTILDEYLGIDNKARFLKEVGNGTQKGIRTEENKT